MLQPLDVGVFSPLAFHYKKELELITRFSTVTVDKVDFLQIVQKARKSAISFKNIQTAWRVTGLVPYNPSVVLQKLINKQLVAQNIDKSIIQSTISSSSSSPPQSPKITASFCPGTPKIHYTSSDGAAMLVENTPANVNQVDRLIKRMCEESNLDASKNQALQKLVKGAKFALADSVLLRITNQELLQANTRKNRRANRTGNHYGGEARILSLRDVLQRQQWAINKENEQKEKKQAAEMRRLEIEFNKAFKDLGRLGPDLLSDVSKRWKGKFKEGAEEGAEIETPKEKGKGKGKEVEDNMLKEKNKGKEMTEEVIEEVIQVEEVIDDAIEGSSKAVNNEGLVRISRSGRMIKPPRKM